MSARMIKVPTAGGAEGASFVEVDGSLGSPEVDGRQTMSTVTRLLCREDPSSILTVAKFSTRCPQLSARESELDRATAAAVMCTRFIAPGMNVPKSQLSELPTIAHPLSEPNGSIIHVSPDVPALPAGVLGAGPTRGRSDRVALVQIGPVLVTTIVKPTRPMDCAVVATIGASAVFTMLT